MALNNKSNVTVRPTDNVDSTSVSDNSRNDPANPKGDYDIERQQSLKRGIRSGSESIDKASVGRQIELEAENAIKYRTCSWQKVRSLTLTPRVDVIRLPCFLRDPLVRIHVLRQVYL